MNERKHHVYGPSTLDSLEQCVRFKYDESKNADAGDEGTMLHAAFETGDTSGLSEEQRDDVETIRKYVESLKYENGATPEEWEDHREIRLVLRDLTHGTADCIIYHEKTGVVHVVDAKFTRVESEHGMQIRAYGAMFAERLMLDKRLATRVHMHIAAPRLGPPVMVDEDAGVLVSSVRERIEALYERVENPFTPPTPQSDVCKNCARAAKCPALSRGMEAIAKGSGLPLPATFDIEKVETDRDRAILQVMAGAVDQWASQVKKANAEYVKNGGTLPGFKLMRRSTGARLPKENAAEFARRMSETFGLDAEALLGCSNVAFGDVASLVALTTGQSERAAKAQTLELITDLTREGFSEFLTKERRQTDEETLGLIEQTTR